MLPLEESQSMVVLVPAARVRRSPLKSDHDERDVFRPANRSVLDAKALEEFVVARARRHEAGSFSLSVQPGTYLVAGPDRPGGFSCCGAHLCFGCLGAALPPGSLNMTGVKVVLGQRVHLADRARADRTGTG